MNTTSNPENKSSILTRPFTSIILYRNFRLLWLGSWTEHMGEWMETTALLWLINQMTQSPFMATLMVTLRYLPLVVFAYIGGILADHVDRRDLLMTALAAGAESGRRRWRYYLACSGPCTRHRI